MKPVQLLHMDLFGTQIVCNQDHRQHSPHRHCQSPQGQRHKPRVHCCRPEQDWNFKVKTMHCCWTFGMALVWLVGMSYMKQRWSKVFFWYDIYSMAVNASRCQLVWGWLYQVHPTHPCCPQPRRHPPPSTQEILDQYQKVLQVSPQEPGDHSGL